MKFSRIKMITLTVAVLSLAACATNEYDAAIAGAEASIEINKELAYAKGIASANTPKPLVEIKGEVRCSDKQILDNLCGVIFFNPNARSIAPHRDKNWVDGVEAVGNTLVRGAEALTPIVLAKEVTNIVKEVGKSSGGNTTNTNSGNSHTEQKTNIAKTSGGDLLDDGSSKDASTISSVANTEDISGTKVAGNLDAHTEENSAVHDESIKDSNNGGNGNSSTVIQDAEVTPTESDVE